MDVGSNLAKKITVADNAASIYDYMGEQCPNSMFINPVNKDEVVHRGWRGGRVGGREGRGGGRDWRDERDWREGREGRKEGGRE